MITTINHKILLKHYSFNFHSLNIASKLLLLGEQRKSVMLQPLNGLTGPVVNNQSYNNNSNEMGSFEKSGIQNSNKHTHPNPISGMFLIKHA